MGSEYLCPWEGRLAQLTERTRKRASCPSLKIKSDIAKFCCSRINIYLRYIMCYTYTYYAFSENCIYYMNVSYNTGSYGVYARLSPNTCTIYTMYKWAQSICAPGKWDWHNYSEAGCTTTGTVFRIALPCQGLPKSQLLCPFPGDVLRTTRARNFSKPSLLLYIYIDIYIYIYTSICLCICTHIYDDMIYIIQIICTTCVTYNQCTRCIHVVYIHIHVDDVN